MKLLYYTDPGHGWVAVKRTVLEKFGVLDKISAFSYQRQHMVYLEEDKDAMILAQELKKSNIVVEYVVKSSNRRSKIRNYQSFVAS